MKTLFCSTLVLFLVACGGGSSEANNTAKFSKAPPGEQAATLREMHNEFSKKCPDLKMGELSENEANRYAKDCSSEELTKLHETLVCMQKTACEDKEALRVCLEKMKGVSNQCRWENSEVPKPPRPNPHTNPETPGNHHNHDHESHAGHNHGGHAHGVPEHSHADMPEAMKNMFNNMGNAGQNHAGHAQPDDTAPNPEGDSDDAEDGQTPAFN